jgi:hypothetical protein
VHYMQGDQIEQKIAYWVTFFFGYFFEKDRWA